MTNVRVGAGLLALALLVTTALHARPAGAASAAEIDRSASAAMADLYATTPGAQDLGRAARAILIFPNIVKAGFLFGAQYGEGALQQNGRSVAYYNSVAASYGLQAGIQSFGYALFFMNDGALRYLQDSAGFEIGTGPSVVIVDAGMAQTFTTTTLRSDVYAIIFDQRGLMAGLGLQGSKISRIDK